MLVFGNDMILYWDDRGVATMFDLVLICCVFVASLCSFLLGTVGPNPAAPRGRRTQTRPEDQTGPDPTMSNLFVKQTRPCQ